MLHMHEILSSVRITVLHEYSLSGSAQSSFDCVSQKDRMRRFIRTHAAYHG